ncbi:MAG: hypothetical protein IPP27_18890 [Bacteroidetes bacterium]|nr:hypothetical protein [Bacteroidota bacterium]
MYPWIRTISNGTIRISISDDSDCPIWYHRISFAPTSRTLLSLQQLVALQFLFLLFLQQISVDVLVDNEISLS